MNAAPAWDVTAVRYGTRALRKSDAYHRFDTFGEPDAPLDMDYFFACSGTASAPCSRHRLDRVVGERRGRTCLTTPVEALARLGVSPGLVSQVVVTHLHYDHVGNLDAFPDAELVVHERELDFWAGRRDRRPSTPSTSRRPRSNTSFGRVTKAVSGC